MSSARYAMLALLLTACEDSPTSDVTAGSARDSSVEAAKSSEDAGDLANTGEQLASASQASTEAGVQTTISVHLGADSSNAGGDGTLVSVPADLTDADPADASLAIHACGLAATADWRRCDGNPLWQAGFEHAGVGIELSVGDPDVMYDAEDGIYKAWWSVGIAPSYVDESVAMGIKYAESADGVHWVVQEELAIAGHGDVGDWDYSKLETPTVVKVPEFPPERRYVLFYAGGNDLAVPAPEYTWYQIGVAFSADGKHFERLPSELSPYADQATPFENVEGLVIYGTDVFPASMPGLADGLVADPEVINESGVLHVFFSSLAVDSQREPLAFGVSHATSTDAIHWTFATANPLPNLAGAGPSVVKSEQGYELWFYADSDAEKATIPSVFNPMLGVFRSTSTNLTEWSAPSASRDLTWDGNFATERYGMVAAGDMLFHDGEYRYYYPAFGDFNVPEDFVVPTHDDYLPAVIMLNLAYRN